ncbi:hypothetical protein DY000_02062818 [Brassica cretica]|uniref:Uncharacterized protein n=1 Tax=Brassica cretica TaxID=69181 RepID=A0ABQ7B242_BRACR|nr:hypothetical protein DY000_02062818 [Brassica cretica]
MMLPVFHVSSISKSGVSLSHREKFVNSLSTEDEDPAPTMGSSATVTACMLLLLCFDPPQKLPLFIISNRLSRSDPFENEPAAVRDGTGQDERTQLLSLPMWIQPQARSAHVLSV